MSNKTKFWTWHLAAGVLLLVLLGLHMVIMHMGGVFHAFAHFGGDSVSVANSQWRDGRLDFAVGYILMLGAGLYHGLYGLRTILFELTPGATAKRTITVVLSVTGIALFLIGSIAAGLAHMNALSGVRN